MTWTILTYYIHLQCLCFPCVSKNSIKVLNGNAWYLLHIGQCVMFFPCMNFKIPFSACLYLLRLKLSIIQRKVIFLWKISLHVWNLVGILCWAGSYLFTLKILEPTDHTWLSQDIKQCEMESQVKPGLLSADHPKEGLNPAPLLYRIKQIRACAPRAEELSWTS